MIRKIMLIISSIIGFFFLMNIYALANETCNPKIQSCINLKLLNPRHEMNIWVLILEDNQIKKSVQLNYSNPIYTYTASQLDSTIGLKIANEECYSKSFKGPGLLNIGIFYDLKKQTFICQ